MKSCTRQRTIRLLGLLLGAIFWLAFYSWCRGQMAPTPGASAPAPAVRTKALLSPRAATATPTGQPLALPPKFYFRAIFPAATNGAVGLYWSLVGQQANNFIGVAAVGVGHIPFTGPMPTNPLSLWATYADNSRTPVILFDTNAMVLSTNAAMPRIVSLKLPAVIVPVTNLTICISNRSMVLVLSNSVDLVNWSWLGILTNGSFNLPLTQPVGFIKAVVAQYPVMFNWTPSSDPADGYELFSSSDGIGWVDYDLLPATNSWEEILQYPNPMNYFTLATYGTNGDFSTFCNPTMVNVPRPSLKISR